jgi:hypothetical protein
VSGLLSSHGVSDEDASYYEEHINNGGYFVSVDSDQTDVAPETAREILMRNGGHSASSQRATAV